MNAEWEARMEQIKQEEQKRKEQTLLEKNVDEQTLIKSIRGKYNLREEDVKDNLLFIIGIEKEQEKCMECKGLEVCTHTPKGYFHEISKNEGFGIENYFSYSSCPCRYERQSQEQAHIKRLLESSGVPRIYKEISFDEYKETDENRKAIEAAHWIVNDDKDSSVYFYGSKGTGKTMLSCVITNEIARRGKVVLFSSVPDLMADIRASFKSDNTEEVINSVKNAPILVLDDLGAERATEWVGEQIFAIINARYADKRKTIITSNFAPDELAAHFADKTQGERIVSRIYGMCARVQIKGKDWRMSA